jgi:hypothetical protein
LEILIRYRKYLNKNQAKKGKLDKNKVRHPAAMCDQLLAYRLFFSIEQIRIKASVFGLKAKISDSLTDFGMDFTWSLANYSFHISLNIQAQMLLSGSGIYITYFSS